MSISELLKRLSTDFSSLNTGDKILGGLVVTLLCMSIVFVVLVVLMYIVKAIRLFRRGAKADGQEKAQAAPAAQAKALPETDDDSEIAAVIAAALAAAEGSGTNVVVRSIARTPDQSSQWSKIGPNPGVNGAGGWN